MTECHDAWEFPTISRTEMENWVSWVESWADVIASHGVRHTSTPTTPSCTWRCVLTTQLPVCPLSPPALPTLNSGLCRTDSNWIQICLHEALVTETANQLRSASSLTSYKGWERSPVRAVSGRQTVVQQNSIIISWVGRYEQSFICLLCDALVLQKVLLSDNCRIFQFCGPPHLK